MTPEKVAALKASAPSVWVGNHFEHEDGWFGILLELSPKLEKLGAVIGGAKEKYARLDFYVSSPKPPYGTSEIEALLKRASEKSMQTCEVCGEPGRHVETENMWESIKCRKHQGDSRPTSPDSDFVEAGEPHKPMPNPTEAMLKDPVWCAIWNTIKSWDVNVPEFYNGYCGANGSHATLIYEAFKKAGAAGHDDIGRGAPSEPDPDAKWLPLFDAVQEILRTHASTFEFLDPLCDTIDNILDPRRSRERATPTDEQGRVSAEEASRRGWCPRCGSAEPGSGMVHRWTGMTLECSAITATTAPVQIDPTTGAAVASTTTVDLTDAPNASKPERRCHYCGWAEEACHRPCPQAGDGLHAVRDVPADTCPRGHHGIVRLHDEIMHDVKDAVGCASCGCGYSLVNERWFEVPWKPTPHDSPCDVADHEPNVEADAEMDAIYAEHGLLEPQGADPALQAAPTTTPCTPDPEWGCEARRKLGIARGALYAAKEAIEDQQAMPDQGPIDAIDKALADTAQPQPCTPMALKPR